MNYIATKNAVCYMLNRRWKYNAKEEITIAVGWQIQKIVRDGLKPLDAIAGELKARRLEITPKERWNALVVRKLEYGF